MGEGKKVKHHFGCLIHFDLPCNCSELERLEPSPETGSGRSAPLEAVAALEQIRAEFSIRDLQMSGKCTHLLTRDAQERVWAIVTAALGAETAKPSRSEAKGSESIPVPLHMHTKPSPPIHEDQE